MIKSFYNIWLILTLAATSLSAAGPLAFKDLLQNYPAVADQYAWDSYQRGHFLIIGVDAVFTNPYLDLFRVFKERQGFRVSMVPLSETGNSSSDIRSYIAEYYTSHDLEYVLLIGDVDGAYALPAFSYGPQNDVSDLPYVLIEGGTDDYFPEA
ncbi:MAG: C25 family cysteine peptidase, partial [Candidatus Marinimicrobia bacterium]|nr:C25 family cysteine peptidase [Candidatus Neomarinimicrobiota bacterium]